MRWLVLAVLLAGATAHADDTPWAAGVTAEHQKAALDLYNKGNVAFAQAEYKDALEIYVEALAIWDHPAIRYNAAVCRINLDRPLEAFEDLERAMKFGPAPLGPDLFKQGLSYQKLLAKQVAELEVAVDEPDAKVSLDGKLLFTAPGSQHQRVLAGDHQIVVEKPGFQTETQAARLVGGEVKKVSVVLKPLAAARTLHRRWSRWVPWAVLGAGAVIAAAGVPPMLAVRGNYDLYDAAVSSGACVSGCKPGQLDADMYRSRGRAENIAAVSLFIAGGAVAATGFVMVILNQPRLGPVTPMIGGDRAGLVVSGRF